jgi:hypothetical protein
MQQLVSGYIFGLKNTNFNSFQRLIGVQDADSCGKSELGETTQERSDEEAHQPPAESEVLHGNQKRH